MNKKNKQEEIFTTNNPFELFAKIFRKKRVDECLEIATGIYCYLFHKNPAVSMRNKWKKEIKDGIRLFKAMGNTTIFLFLGWAGKKHNSSSYHLEYGTREARMYLVYCSFQSQMSLSANEILKNGRVIRRYRQLLGESLSEKISENRQKAFQEYFFEHDIVKRVKKKTCADRKINEKKDWEKIENEERMNNEQTEDDKKKFFWWTAWLHQKMLISEWFCFLFLLKRRIQNKNEAGQKTSQALRRVQRKQKQYTAAIWPFKKLNKKTLTKRVFWFYQIPLRHAF